MKLAILGLVLCFADTAFGIMGGIPANPNQGNQGNQGGGGVAGTQAQSATVQAAQAAATQAVTLASAQQSASTAATQTAIVLRGLVLSPHASWDLWANATGSFDGVKTAAIHAGADYRVKPSWVVGLLANWALARHVDGSAMDGGIYTALSQWGFYLLGSEIWHQEPETYLTFSQLGYVANICQWLSGPFYSVQYSTKHDLIENQAGWWLNRSFGRWSPEAQVMLENNCKRLHHENRNFIWAGVSLNYKIAEGVFLSGGYNTESNRHIQTSQVTFGFKAMW